MASSDYKRRFPASKSQIVMALARNVRRLRKAKGWSQEDLAEKVGIEQTAVSLIENSRANPTIETLETLAQCFNVSFVELFDSKAPKS